MHSSNTDSEIYNFYNSENQSDFHLRREQVALSQFVVQLHPLFEEQLLLLSEVGDLLSDLLRVLSAATTQ